MGEFEILPCPFCGAPYREFIPPGTVQVKCHYCGATVLVPPRLGGPIQLCPNHPESLAIGFCSRCHKSFCGNCLFLVKMPPGEGGTAVSDIYFLCGKCKGDLKKSYVNAWLNEYRGYFVSGSYLLLIILIIVSFWIFLILLPVIITSNIIFSLYMAKIIRKRYEALPTIIKFREKMQELNNRVESLKATLTADELYHRIVGGKWTRLDVGYKPFVERRLEEYMKSGLDRKEALLKIMSEDNIEIEPGVHIPPTIDDVLHIIERETKREQKRNVLKT